ncbi:hypothetical protein [Roseobacter ponti]|nr:hypothetical protein [Roseobacter ponti]
MSGETWPCWQDPDGYECIETGYRPWETGAVLLAAVTKEHASV